MIEKEILTDKNIAVIGVSKNPRKFGRIIFAELEKKDFKVFGINKNFIDGEKPNLYSDLAKITEKINSVIFVTKPDVTLIELKKCFSKGIKKYWFQQGSESKEVIDFCKKNNLTYVAGKCVFMYLEPVKGIHKLHLFINKLFKKY